MKSMNRCVTYLRRSTDKQEQSIEDQRSALLRYAASEGLEIVKEYVDDAISGADTKARLAFSGMITDAQDRNRTWDVILVFDVTRFGRQQADEAGYYRHLLAEAGVQVVYANEGFTGGESDGLLLSVKQHMAHQMVLDVSKLTIRGQVSRATKGRWCGGRPPYGYDLVHFGSDGEPYQVVRYLRNGNREIRDPGTGKLVRVIPKGERLRASGEGHAQLVRGAEDRVEILQRIYSMYVAEGMGFGAIAKRLNTEGVPSPGRVQSNQVGPSKWSISTVREILRNPVYRGAVIWNRRSFSKFHSVEDGRAKRKPKHTRTRHQENPKGEWIIHEEQHEALVSEHVWRQAQREMAARGGSISGEQLRAAKGNSPYLLSGLIRCGRCQSNWQGYKTRQGRKREGRERIVTEYYCCGSYIRQGNAGCERVVIKKEELEQLVLEAVAGHLRDFIESGGAEILAQYAEEAAGKDLGDEKRLQESMQQDQTQLDNLIACITPDLAPSLSPKIQALQEKMADARAKLAERGQLRANQREARRWVKELLRKSEGLLKLIRTGTLSDQKTILRALVDRVVIDPDHRSGSLHLFATPKVSALSPTPASLPIPLRLGKRSG